MSWMRDLEKRGRTWLAAPSAHDARHRLSRFYQAVLAADMSETTTPLAETISTWGPEVGASCGCGHQRPHRSGNRVIKQLKRSAAAIEIKATMNLPQR